MKHVIQGWIALIMTLIALGGSTTASSYTVDTKSSPSVLTGLWWNASESGWGLTITQQYGVIFVAMYTYDAVGNPVWYAITNCPVVAGGCTGDIYKVNGGSPLTTVWRPNLALTKVGAGTLAFADENTASMSFTIDGINAAKAITRQVFAAPPTDAAYPITFKGVVLNSMSYNVDLGFCKATLSISNGFYALPFGLLVFDVFLNGTKQFGQMSFSTSDGSTSITSNSVRVVLLNTGTATSCNGINLVFVPGLSF